ncbi:MAG: adenosylcobalamin-dependent ribonucleoside-diphosphate reductase [Gemmatimonadetes bacterium]|nr:adenosylcobalamin-dependent ribonucleoside-diphosphate reductase [Gemmatimonadota bacterium]
MPHLELTENALRVLRARYLRRDPQGEIMETPEELFRRVARGVAHAELPLHGRREAAEWEELFLEKLVTLEFLPNSPTLMNAGASLGQLSGCFVLPVPDSIPGIFESLKQMAIIQQSGGGTGFSFSRLRPRGAVVRSTGGKSSGPVSFMRIFDCATEQVEQGGKRRGVNMGVLRVDHPDIEEFIEVKRAEDELRNFNISVGATDAFMRAAANAEPYALIDPQSGGKAGERSAAAIFERIAEAAWRTGDPGLVFLDTANRAHPLPHLGALEATNPCGEIPLLPYESCNLGSINLARMLDPAPTPQMKWEKLGQTVRVAVRFLDDVIEVNRYPLRETEEITRRNRKIGLGVIGFAEALVQLQVAYDSESAVAFADELMAFIAAEALEASRELARVRGVFPHWNGSRLEQQRLRVRNATCTAIAPTGTISIIAGTSASIEPFYSLAYRRTNVLSGETLLSVNPLVEAWAGRYDVDVPAVMREVRRTGRIGDLAGIPEKLRFLFRTAPEIPPERPLQIQAAFQRHADNAVSKTINLPTHATPEDVATAYRRAWELELKGITLFRHGSKQQQVLEPGAGEDGNDPL